MSELGNLLLSLMQEKGLSYGVLSNMTGISKATLQRYVSGTTENIPFDRLEIIAKALGVNVGYLCAKSTINEMKLRGEYTSEMMELLLDSEQGAVKGKAPTPVSESGQPVNIVKIASRDGSFVEKRLNDKELQALKAFVDLLPDASDEL